MLYSTQFTNKFNLRINLTEQEPGRPKNELCENKLDWLSDFMERPNVICTNPGRKTNTISVEKI